jgi:thymidylate kinase
MDTRIQEYLNGIGLLVHHETIKPDLTVYAVNNPDGSTRWIWNSASTKPHFLGFYATTNWKSKIINLAFKVIFVLKLQHLLYKTSQIGVQINPEHPLSDYLKNDFALFTGTEGPNRKLILLAGKESEEKRFIKIAISESSTQLVDNEYDKLLFFGQGSWYRTPQAVLLSKGIVALEDMRGKGKRLGQFTTLHAKVIEEWMNMKKPEVGPMKSSPVYLQVNELLCSLSNTVNDKLPGIILHKLNLLSQSLEQCNLLHAPAHGDFTPWNCFCVDKKLHVYDFELARLNVPFGFDAFHFVFQQGIFVEHLSWKNIKVRMQTAFQKLQLAAGMNNSDWIDYLKAYLLVNVTYYADLYNRQDKWHIQIYWQLAVWNDALSDLLSDINNARSFLIRDVFALLYKTPYVAIKFPDIEPGELSVFSDIDLLLTKNDSEMLKRYVHNHSLVQSVKSVASTHMNSDLLLLVDGSIVAIDAIWKLKRKALQFMDEEAVIRRGLMNSYGVKIMDSDDLKTYLLHFYGLNGAPVPERYQGYFKEELQPINFRELKNVVRNKKYNSGVKGLLNALSYLNDTIMKNAQQKGMVITFSGVDGAGKSTVIEKVRSLLEKKLRREVVVIRHRPSLLPILSAYTYGKAEAEQRAANTLPRQGSNKSTLSSLFRFAYYYADYLFGQFYVWAKYVARGKVVLYDRYYFDFINDSVRSNIRLPKWIMKAGYGLLMQPSLNFFLYADAATILKRKKELDEQAIAELTRQYLELFMQLEKKGSSRYFPIENIELEETLSFILDKIQTKLFS